MNRKCLECKFYSLGHAECHRFPPVPVVFKDRRYDTYNNLVEFDNLMWTYPPIDNPDHHSCSEFVENPRLSETEDFWTGE